MALPAWQYPILFSAGLAAGLLDSIAGGGGLITLPVLLGVGLPPQAALGTNKLQSSFGSGSATRHFVQTGTVRLRECLPGIAFTFVGAALGAWTVQRLNPELLRALIPWFLVAIAVYVLVSPRLGFEDHPARVKPMLFFAAAGLGFGFYDGFFGPGVGSFWVLAIMLALGFNMTKATGWTKVMNFTSNVVSLAVFALGGHVWLVEGLVMAAGEIVGARIGAGLVVKRGARLIRPIFISVALAITVKLLWDQWK
jgi:uncharacterized membrane protein YfcA